MSISEIQKKKFLDNIYRMAYSTGLSIEDKKISQPDEREIKRLFDEYFTQNRIGVPLSIDVSNLRNIETVEPDVLNEYMAKALLNLEVLYDSIDESNHKLLDTISFLNKKFSNLKDRRAALESKIDNILFSLSNTDGYFYSFSDPFSSIENVDLNLTTAFVDTENRKVTLPKLKSSVLEFNAPGKVAYSNVTYSLYFNGSVVQENREMPDVNNLFDGLENTKSTIEFSSDSQGACALVLSIPLLSPFVVSRIDGRIFTSSAVSVIAEIIDAQNREDIQFKRKQSNSDYDRFSFDFAPQESGTIRITLIKYEPDSIDTLSPTNKYKYMFSFRDLIISGQYYDANASLVSSPISIPAGDNNKIIDAVSVDAVNTNSLGGNITYFVAQDVPNATNMSDFNWIPISSSSTNSPSFDQLVSFNKSTKVIRNIKLSASGDDISLYPISTSENISEKNPTTSIYNGISVYRIGNIGSTENIYNPYILDSLNSISFKYISYTPNLYLDKDRWSAILNGSINNFNVFNPGNISITNSPSIPISLNLNGVSGYMQTKLLSSSEQVINSVISRSGNATNWNLAVYLNGSLLVDMPDGVSSKEISWSFIEGVNDIVITFDAEGNSSGSISLMSGFSISNYGSVFLNYYSYVDPFDFRTSRTEQDKVFTIDNYLGNKEILSRSSINDNSRIVYYQNDEFKVDAIRFRADLSRFSNPFSTPALNSYRIKFKNSV